MTPLAAQALFSVGQGPQLEFDPSPLYQRVEAHAAQRPQALAVCFLAQSLSYGALNVRANQLAHALRQRGVTANCPVASFFEPGLEVAVVLLAIHKAGGIYVPLDPNHPPERIAALLDDIQPQLLLTLEYLQERLPATEATVFCLDKEAAALAQQATGNPEVPTDPEQTAYIVYTSGTTGKPKGVMASHANLNHYILSAQHAYGLCAADRMPTMARFTFSISMFELWSPLVAGGQLHLVPRAHVLDFERMVELLERITFIHCAPSLMRNLLNFIDAQGIDTWRFQQLRHASCGGDFVAFELLERMKQTFAATEIFVIYGCTEISCMGCTDQALRDQTLTRNSVGRPMANVSLRLLDAQQQPVPLGVMGEVYFGGPGINQGYWKLPELSRQKFVSLDGQRFYGTGDWGRMDATGKLELLGRTDFQMKVRGMRMEPVEIENVLRQVPGVRDTLVAAHKLAGQTEKTLVAYLVFQADANADLGNIRRFLQARLPDYMVPSQFVPLSALPTNLNGKLDRSALPTPTADMLLQQDEGGPPETPTERALAQIWERVLNRHPVRRNSDFFALGGDSLSSVLMLLEVKQALGYELAVDAPLKAPTLQAMADTIDAGGVANDQPGLVNLRTGGTLTPLFCVYGALLYRELSSCLAPNRPVFAAYLPEEVSLLAAELSAADQPGLRSVPDMARRYLDMIRRVQSHGPYLLAGHSLGGLVVYEMAQQLKRCGESVALVIMTDCQVPHSHVSKSRSFKERLLLHARYLREQKLGYIRMKLARRIQPLWWALSTHLLPWYRRWHWSVPRRMQEAAGFLQQQIASYQTSDTYQVQPYDGPVLLLRATHQNSFMQDELPDLGWSPLVSHLSIEDVPGDHMGMLQSPNVQVLAAHLNRHLAAFSPDDFVAIVERRRKELRGQSTDQVARL